MWSTDTAQFFSSPFLRIMLLSVSHHTDDRHDSSAANFLSKNMQRKPREKHQESERLVKKSN